MALPEIFLSSDHHFGHARIIELSARPFSSVREMNETIIERHNAMVTSRDIVWLLGDLAMGKIDETLPLIARLNGRKRAIAGNHDRFFAGAERDAKKRAVWARRYREEGGIEHIVDGARFPSQRIPIRLPVGPLRTPTDLWHFPHAGESDPARPDRYADYRPVAPRRGPTPWLLHGHVHEAWCVRDRQINVGVDVWNFEPVPLELLAALIEDANE